jgi:hypothetical protein
MKQTAHREYASAAKDVSDVPKNRDLQYSVLNVKLIFDDYKATYESVSSDLSVCHFVAANRENIHYIPKGPT